MMAATTEDNDNDDMPHPTEKEENGNTTTMKTSTPPPPPPTDAASTTTTTNHKNTNATSSSASASSSSFWAAAIIDQAARRLEQQKSVLIVSLGGVILASLWTGNVSFFFWLLLKPIWSAAWHMLGMACGVGLGLGLATHVYDCLTIWKERQEQQQQHGQQSSPTVSFQHSSSRMQRQSSAASAGTSGGGAYMEDEQTYASLMQAAGYYPSAAASPDNKKVLRGQVLRHDDAFFQPNYTYEPDTAGAAADGAVVTTSSSSSSSKKMLQELWPVLPVAIRNELARFIEYLVRDYVASWYSMMDAACPYVDEKQKRTQQQQQKQDSSQQQQQQQQQQYARVMVYSLGPHRPLPVLETLYESLVLVLGNLANRVEHVNILEVVLLKWTRILAHTFKTYRLLRKHVTTKTMTHSATSSNTNASTATAAKTTTSTLRSSTAASSNTAQLARKIQPPSEMKMTKEFLFAGKLHRAVTFGLDVPSLLFADGTGKECGRPTNTVRVTTNDDQQPPLDNDNNNNNNNNTISEDDLLEERLFQTNLIYECELDYNRVLAHRLVRALLPRSDYSSPIVCRLVTELLAGCVLMPIMGCLSSPEYLNNWILDGLSSLSSSTSTSTTSEESSNGTNNNNTNHNLPEGRVDSGEGGTTAEESVEMTMSKAQLVTIHDDDEDDKDNDGGSNKEKDNNGMMDNAPKNGADQQPNMASTETPSPMTTTTRDGSAQENEVAKGKDAPTENLQPQQFPGDGDGSAEVTGDDIITLLATALIDLQRYIAFDEFNNNDTREEQGRILNNKSIDWDDASCRAAILRLVLIIEAALTNGRCTYRVPSEAGTEMIADDVDIEEDEEEEVDNLDDSERPVEVTLPEYESTTLSQILMEMTNDIEAFEERVATENTQAAEEKDVDKYKDEEAEDYKPSPTEQSTLRTLIAAWLHTGQIYRTVTVLVQAHATVLAPYYRSNAFLRTTANANGFVRQLKSLDGIEILVDTMSVLVAPRLDEMRGDELNALVRKSSPTKPNVESRAVEPPLERAVSPSSILSAQYMTASSTTPRYLDYHRNEAFAASLRSERERRMHSWEAIAREGQEEGLPVVCRGSGATEEDISLHRELHHIAKIFYAGTNLVAIRDAARRKTSSDMDGTSQGDESERESVNHVSLVTVETASQRRRIEIPDDDSSFLLRAQPRPLNAVGVHRDQRNHDQSFKGFAATYEEPALTAGSEHYAGGRYIRRCLLRYYPIDRTASVALQSDARKLDQRKAKSSVPETITVGQSSKTAPFLSTEFLRERHLCQRWIPKGTNRTQSILASSVMEPTDFTSMPRSGKAIDFVYRMSFFERPMVDLGGKHFTVQDSASLGTHRADASSLEISDASLSYALLVLGSRDTVENVNVSPESRSVEMGKDGYPIVYMKFSRKEDDTHVEVKPYRVSFLRAALMVTAARQEAQLQSLMACVRAGSAKKATKALTDARLKPSVKLLEYAGSRSREKQSILLRDLKLGVNHIDREQLRRNGLLSPRYPTVLRELSATIEDSVLAQEVQGAELFGSTGTLYKIRCVAIVDIEAPDNELEVDPEYRTANGRVAAVKEEWVVYRSFKEFQILHKHIKNQVSISESSGTTGSRLVGAAAAAFISPGTIVQGRSRQRQALVPSLSQASKAGALGATRKSILKRQGLLDAYLQYLLTSGHLLSRCPEVMLFVGAFFPLSQEVRLGHSAVSGLADPLGRAEMKRIVVETHAVKETGDLAGNEDSGIPSPPGRSVRTASVGSMASAESQDEEEEFESREHVRKSRKIDMIPSIRNKIDKVPLSLVRNRIFELLRYQFGFENASFIRNRMLAALKTASFAVTSASEFRRTLYKVHTEQLSAESIAEWIKFGVDKLWPDGVFFESAPPTSTEELEEQKRKSRRILHESFPEQLRAVLGQELTRDGLDIFHEMLQNRLVVKSMAYMLFDLLWLEIFPEIGDVLECGAALDIIES